MMMSCQSGWNNRSTSRKAHHNSQAFKLFNVHVLVHQGSFEMKWLMQSDKAITYYTKAL